MIELKRAYKINNLNELVGKVIECKSEECKIKSENIMHGIPIYRIKIKKNAKVIFLGRDPNKLDYGEVVGDLSNTNHSFHKEISKLIQKANIGEEKIYITNILKCHWYSKSTNIKEFEYRKDIKKTSFDAYTKICSETWFVQELKLINPKLIVSFGEDNFIALNDKITYPNLSFDKFTEAEQWELENGLKLRVKFGEKECPLVILRHPGFFCEIDSLEYINNNIIKDMLIECIRSLKL